MSANSPFRRAVDRHVRQPLSSILGRGERVIRDAAGAVGVRRPRSLRGARLETPFVAHPIRTERLLLRPHTMSDAAAWHRIESDPEVRRGLNWPERTDAEIRAHFRHRTRHTTLLQEGDFLALAVEDRGELVGDVSMHLRAVHAHSRVVEVGWLVHPDHTGRGIAFEAARGLINWAFDELGAITVTAVIEPSNQPSMRLAKRLGFELAGSCAGRLIYARTSVRRLVDELDRIGGEREVQLDDARQGKARPSGTRQGGVVTH